MENSILFIIAVVLFFLDAFGVHVVPGTLISTLPLGLACYALGHAVIYVRGRSVV